uniref:Uncharacterized protein n=1 Tax=Setaria italica TaxID=4555 RepID=K3XNY3_SETIT
MLSNLPCVRSFSGMERIIFASASLKTSLTTTLSHDPCYCRMSSLTLYLNKRVASYRTILHHHFSKLYPFSGVLCP